MVRKQKKKEKKIVIRERGQRSLDIGKLMRKYSNGMSVSPSAIKAMADRIDLFLEMAMPDIQKIAEHDGCKVIKEIENLDRPSLSHPHITWFFSAVQNKIELVSVLKNKHYHWGLVKNNNNKTEKE